MLQEFRKRAETAWGVLNAHLDGRAFVVGERLTIADLSLCGYLFWPDELGVDWNAYPHVRDWLARIRDAAALGASVRADARTSAARRHDRRRRTPLRRAVHAHRAESP